MNKINVTRVFEEGYLRNVRSIIQEQCDRYQKSVSKLRADIEEMRIHFHEGDTELWVSINNAITMHDHESRSLTKGLRSLKKPYFGRILYVDEDTGKTESLYIGRNGISIGASEQLVADWRAPISNVYYENGIGKCTFLSPDGEDVNLELKLKRTFDIEDGRLIDYLDSEVVSNDELLTKYLSRNKQAVLGEIVATIQKEQNEIIRRSPLRNVLVQGAAGSGKTTVAMHRISYILYNYAERIKPEEFYIIGSNKMLLNYITGVLPELDVEGVNQMTMEELFTKLFYEQWEPDMMTVLEPQKNSRHFGTEYFEKLKTFCDALVSEHIDQNDIVLNRDCFVEGLKNGKGGVYDRSGERGTADYMDSVTDEKGKTDHRYDHYVSCVKLLGGEYAIRYIAENPHMSLMDISRELNAKLSDNVEYELTAKGYGYTEKEKKEIRRKYAAAFGKKDYPEDIYEIYDRFLLKNGEEPRYTNEYREEPGKGRKKQRRRGYDVYDLASLAYIYRRVFGESEKVRAHHVIIDEAQDYGMMAYRVLSYCLKDCTYTIMGDTSQNIRFDSGINNWSEMRELFVSREGDSFSTLRKSYRNTIEISGFATDILEHGDFEIYPVEPIIRHGNEPKVMKVGEDMMIPTIRKTCGEWQSQGHNTIAIVCRTDEEAVWLHERLGKAGMKLLENDPERMEFGNGILVLPVRLTKGLEFDAVLIYDPTNEKYPSDNLHTKLLYVAATRALHELCVLHVGELTGLIADKVSATKVKQCVIADPVTVHDGPSAGEIFRKNLRDKEATLEYEKNEILDGATGRMAKKTNAVSEKAECPEGGAESRLTQAEPQSSEVRMQVQAAALTTFGRSVEDTVITPPGHQNIALTTKWVMKQNDGIYIQSKVGIIRLCPVSAGILRVTYVRGNAFKCASDKLVKKYGMMKSAIIKETPKLLDISLGRLSVTLDKQVGAITYKDAKNHELMKEKVMEPRVILGNGENSVGYTNFMPKRNDTFHALNPADGTYKYVGNTAMYVNEPGSMPLIMVKDSFAIMPINDRKVGFNNLPAKGTGLITFGEEIDFYFIVAEKTEELVAAYKKLSEK